MHPMHHIQCTSDMIGKYVFLPGDPGRVPIIAAYLDNAEFTASNREYVTYTGYLNGTKVSVVSTGIGGPSAAIALEELVRLGAHTFIRVGTCGCMNASLLPGNCIIPTGAIRRDGTSLQYMPIEFPAVAHQDVISALLWACKTSNQTAYTGVVESKDSYYGQHEPEQMPVAPELLYKWECFKQGGSLGSEMECAPLFIISSIRKVRTGAILHIFRNREREEMLHTEPVTSPDSSKTIKIAIDAMRHLIAQDNTADFAMSSTAGNTANFTMNSTAGTTADNATNPAANSATNNAKEMNQIGYQYLEKLSEK